MSAPISVESNLRHRTGANSVELKQVGLSLWRRMNRIRIFEEKIAEIYPNEEIRCPVHLSIGQEATAAGMCEALLREDQVFSSHRGHGHFIAKGGSLRAFMAELFGKETGCCRGVGGSMHLIDLDVGFVAATPIVGGIVPVAVGAALANKLKKNGLVSTLFLGDGTTEEGVFQESISFASLHRLPIVFFCENNFFSVYTHLSERQPASRTIADLARVHGVESRYIDGNDVMKVYQTAREAREWIAAGKGPFFIEAVTYRWREHCGPAYDNSLGYRTEADFQAWKAKDPIARLTKELFEHQLLSDSQMEQELRAIHVEVADALDFARQSPYPAQAALAAHLFPPER